MRRFFDSSVLVPVFYADHIHHAASSAVFMTARKEDAFCALHTLAEVYATLTGLPVRPRITGSEGMTILKQIRDRLTLAVLIVTSHRPEGQQDRRWRRFVKLEVFRALPQCGHLPVKAVVRFSSPSF